ncbi:MAG TPA: DinB family protein [Acidimicrobiales bacterium]|nr:DinB family protein [Acidimicrobiales bacterium]
MERCEECGFDPADLRPRDTVVAVRSFGRRYRAPLTRGLAGEDLDEIVRRSPAPGVWSALDYTGHVVDIFRVFDDRVRCALARVDPDEPVIDWEARVAAASPGLDREATADDLADAADSLAVTLAELTDDEWSLPGLTGRGRPLPVSDLATIAVHEGSHHLLDVGRVLRAARGR